MLDLRLNARVIAATASAPVLDEMRWTGATEHGIGHMLAKGEALAVVLENVERRQANLLKQEMLAAGGDAAVSTGVCSETVAETRVVVVGSRRQFDALLDRLAEEPFDLPAVAREIAAPWKATPGDGSFSGAATGGFRSARGRPSWASST